MDTDQGNAFDPASLHKYLYAFAFANPVNVFDRSGHDGELAEEISIVPAGTTIGAAEAQAGSLAMRVASSLASRGVAFTILGTATALVPEFQNLATAFEENEGIVVQLQDELFAIRYVASAAGDRGLWWGAQMFNSAQQAINDLALDTAWGNTAKEIVFGVIPQDTQLIMGYAASQGSLSGGALQIWNYGMALVTRGLME